MFKNSKILKVLISMALVVSFLSGCNNAKSSNASNNKLTFAIAAETNSMDPQLINSRSAFTTAKIVYEGLVRTKGDKLQPGMAESWEISPDGLIYTFHLRDAKWSDGVSVKAQDFEYAIRRLEDPKVASPYAFAADYIVKAKEFNQGQATAEEMGVKALDDKTLEIKITTPTNYFLEYLDQPNFYPVRQDIIEKYGTDYASDFDKMVYNGPFTLKEWKHEESMTMVKNPDYWDKDNVKLEEIDQLIIPDRDTQLSMFESGSVDFVQIPSTVVPKYKDEGKCTLYMDGSDDWIQINVSDTNKPWLGNKNFRLALNYAIDRTDIMATTTKGVYYPAGRLVLPIVKGVNDYFTKEYPINEFPLKADPAKAKEYLQKAMDELKISDPSQISVTYLCQDDQNTKLLAEAIQDNITRNLGIKFEIQNVTFKQRLDLQTKHQFEMSYSGWGPDYNDPMTYLELFQTGNGQNGGNYSNKEFDELIEKARIETDASKRFEYLKSAEQILIDDAAFVPLQFRQRAWSSIPNLKGLYTPFVGPDWDVAFCYKE